jgi:hypothetical protein
METPVLFIKITAAAAAVIVVVKTIKLFFSFVNDASTQNKLERFVPALSFVCVLNQRTLIERSYFNPSLMFAFTSHVLSLR